MKKILLLFLLISLFPAHASEVTDPSLNAWWLDIQFKPAQRSLGSVPLERFNKEWAYGELLTSIDLAPKISSADFKEFKASRFSFEKRVDLNRNGRRERLVVGVYERQNGVQGRFVAIFEKNKLIKTLAEDGAAGFSALLVDKGEVYWYFCMQCGSAYKLIWRDKSYYLE